MTTIADVLAAQQAALTAQQSAATVAQAYQPPPVVTPSPVVTPGPSGPVTITFTEGVPARISVAGLMPTDADRYHGGWESQVNGFYDHGPNFNWIAGVYFDPKTKEIVYDGSPLSTNGYAVTPNVGYYVAYEKGPYNAHWSYPPVQSKPPAPKAVNGVTTSQSIYGASKHTRPIFCPWDGKLRVYAGDFASFGLQAVKYGGQDGRMLMWAVDPVTQTWTLDYPAKGRVGDQIPLASDRMNMDWDESRQKFWICHGSTRPNSEGGYFANNVIPAGDPRPYAGLAPEKYWKGDGGLAEAMPEHVSNNDFPIFLYDPKGTTSFRAVRLGTNPLLAPWDQNTSCMMGTAFHQASKRWYGMIKAGNGVKLFWLDTTALETAPETLDFQSLQIDLGAGDPYNLTGNADHVGIYGPANTPMFADEAKRLMYFFDVGPNPALLAVTLPGHAQGEHKVVQVADLRTAIGYNIAGGIFGLGSVTVSPIVWVPEHRCIVWCEEPAEEHVGPYTRSLQIDVDTGAVSEGIRFPNSNQDGMPYFPNCGVWHPPTDTLYTFGVSIMTHNRTGGNRSWDSPVWSLDLVPTVWNAYKWVA